MHEKKKEERKMSDLAKRILEQGSGKSPGVFQGMVRQMCVEELEKTPEPAPKVEKKVKKKAVVDGG